MHKPIHTLTIEELRDQEAEILIFLADPNNTQEDNRVMNNVLKQIRQFITVKTSPVTPAPTPPPHEQIKHIAPPPPPPPPIISQAKPPQIPSPEPSPLEGGKGGDQSQITIITPGKPDNLTPQQRADLQNAHITNIALNTNPPTVTIQWPAWDWGERTYTERDARAAFATCIRDLSDSKRAQQGRYRDLIQYMAWWRAIQYYRALTYFWAGNPTRQQLQLNRRDDRFTTIFDMVVAAAVEQHV